MRERERSARKKINQDRSTAVVGLWADDPYHAQGGHAAQAYNDNVGAEKPHREGTCRAVRLLSRPAHDLACPIRDLPAQFVSEAPEKGGPENVRARILAC